MAGLAPFSKKAFTGILLVTSEETNTTGGLDNPNAFGGVVVIDEAVTATAAVAISVNGSLLLLPRVEVKVGAVPAETGCSTAALLGVPAHSRHGQWRRVPGESTKCGRVTGIANGLQRPRWRETVKVHRIFCFTPFLLFLFFPSSFDTLFFSGEEEMRNRDVNGDSVALFFL